MNSETKIADLTPDMIEKFYLDYFNDFLTVEAYADYTFLSVWVTSLLLAEGRKINLSKGSIK